MIVLNLLRSDILNSSSASTHVNRQYSKSNRHKLFILCKERLLFLHLISHLKSSRNSSSFICITVLYCPWWSCRTHQKVMQKLLIPYIVMWFFFFLQSSTEKKKLFSFLKNTSPKFGIHSISVHCTLTLPEFWNELNSRHLKAKRQVFRFSADRMIKRHVHKGILRSFLHSVLEKRWQLFGQFIGASSIWQ